LAHKILYQIFLKRGEHMAKKAKTEQSVKSKEKNVVEQNKNSEHTKKTKKISLFIDVTPDKYFVLCDGKTIKDYQELASLLETLNDDVFFYHVNNERNDFANWVNDVFGEEKLANDIRKSKNKTEIIAIIYKHLFHKLADLTK